MIMMEMPGRSSRSPRHCYARSLAESGVAAYNDFSALQTKDVLQDNTEAVIREAPARLPDCIRHGYFVEE
jgi:hypothetical protein